jgi:hypothetical protein
MPANTYGRAVDIPLTNKSGGGVIPGDVVIVDTTNNDAFTTTTSASVIVGVGVVQDTIANNAIGRVRFGGYAPLVNVNASVTRGHYGATYTVAKQATDIAARAAGTFCQFLTGGTTPDAIIFPSDLGGTALTNPMTTKGDIIVADTGGTPTRLATGTAGQFLMANGAATFETFASRELDYVQFTSAVNLTATTEATANTIVTGSAVSYDGSTVIMVEFFCEGWETQATTDAVSIMWLYDGSTSIGRMGTLCTPAGGSLGVITPAFMVRRLTPSNASHTYSVRGTTTTGTAVANAGAGGIGVAPPGYIRIIRAV